MPAALKILLIFGAILMLTRVRVPLWLAMLLGAIGLDFWAGVAPASVARDFGQAWLQADLWLMAAVLTLIVELGRFLTEHDNAAELVAAVKRWGGKHGRAASLMALPALVGLIPMPAGALFSAPFVAQAGSILPGRSDWKTAVNYWFRHVWECWWPLYPGVIVGMTVLNLDPPRFIAAQFPFTPVSIAAGYFFLIRPHVRSLKADEALAPVNPRRTAFLMTPLALVVVAVFALPPLAQAAWPAAQAQHHKLIAMLGGLAAALALVAFDRARKMGWRNVTASGALRGIAGVFDRRTMTVAATLAGVIVFKRLMESSGLLPLAGRELEEAGIPAVAAVAALPFLAGLVTGIALAFTGTSFPLVAGLMAVPGSGLTPLATLVLAYSFGYIGMMLSPVHLCFVVTRDYFESDYVSVYRHILPCAAVVLAFGIIAHVALRAAGL